MIPSSRFITTTLCLLMLLGGLNAVIVIPHNSKEVSKLIQEDPNNLIILGFLNQSATKEIGNF